ncbi:MAG: M20/M25/M40 family metallo-hydrolase [Anaerolineae bacterium]
MRPDVKVTPAEVLATLSDLIAIPSINPDLVPGAMGEAPLAEYCANFMRAAGLRVAVQEAAPGRPNAVGILPGTGGGRSLMLNGHMDTVGVEGMPEPFTARREGSRIRGRGSVDMKGSIAAMLWAAKAIAQSGVRLKGDLIITCVCDEEYASLGTEAIARQYTADAAIVTEPTDLDLCLAHRGFMWIEIETKGRAAHGSRPNEGIDAIAHMGRVLVALEAYAQELAQRPHPPLVTPPSVHASIIEGGRELSVYPDECVLKIERRTVAGETRASVMAEMDALLGELAAADPTFQAEARFLFSREPFETAAEEPIAQAVARAIEGVRGRSPQVIGQTFWTDAALLQAAGIPTVLFGCAGAGLHSIAEWVDADSVVQTTEALIATALDWCGVND